MGSPPAALSSLASVLLALASFTGTASWIRSLSPLPDQGTIQGKLEAYFDEADEYDVALFGTSRVFAGLNPLVLEEELASRGVDAHIYNLGLPGVAPYEVDYYLRRVLAHSHERLKLVLVEAWWGPPVALDRNAFTHRRVEWHDAHQTLRVLRAALREPSWEWRERLLQAEGHVQLFGWRFANYGRGPDIRDRFTRTEPADAGDAQGYRAWVKGAGHGGPNRGKPLSWSRPRVNADELDPGVDLALFREQVELADEHALQLIHALLPGNRDPFPVAKLRAEVARVIDYRPPPPGREDKLEHLAFLNDPELHLDNLHLTPEGADRFSRLVASDLAELLGASE